MIMVGDEIIFGENTSRGNAMKKILVLVVLFALFAEVMPARAEVAPKIDSINFDVPYFPKRTFFKIQVGYIEELDFDTNTIYLRWGFY